MKSLIIVTMVLIGGNTFACQYGVDSTQRMDEVIQKEYPNATDVTGDGLQDATIISLPSILDPFHCPSDFRLTGHLKFINDGKSCKGKIVLKYRDNDFYSGKIRSVSCRAI